jgi:hypothetical protein
MGLVLATIATDDPVWEVCKQTKRIRQFAIDLQTVVIPDNLPLVHRHTNEPDRVIGRLVCWRLRGDTIRAAFEIADEGDNQALVDSLAWRGRPVSIGYTPKHLWPVEPNTTTELQGWPYRAGSDGLQIALFAKFVHVAIVEEPADPRCYVTEIYREEPEPMQPASLGAFTKVTQQRHITILDRL